MKILNKIIEERIKKWEHENPARKVTSPKGKPFPVITISREFGSPGAALAEYMGKKIGFKVWDREIVQAIADKFGRDQKFLETLDETRREVIEDLVVGFMNNISTNESYLRTLTQVIKTIDELGNSVIVGRGANYICENPNSLHVRIVCPVKKRTANYAAKEKISKEEAFSVIKNTDKERAEFIQYHFKKNVSESSDYDLILNSETFDLNEMMLIVLEAYHRKSGFKINILN